MILRESGKSTYWLEKNTKFGSSYLHDWDNGSSPTLATLVELADLIGVTVDYLVGRE